jgi:hypothetical protein
MTAAIFRELQRAGVSSGPLKTWIHCSERGAKDECEECWLQGPEGCADTVISSLVERLIISTRQTDQVLGQRDYWKGVADNMTNVVLGRPEAPDSNQKRRY